MLSPTLPLKETTPAPLPMKKKKKIMMYGGLMRSAEITGRYTPFELHKLYLESIFKTETNLKNNSNRLLIFCYQQHFLTLNWPTSQKCFSSGQLLLVTLMANFFWSFNLFY